MGVEDCRVEHHKMRRHEVGLVLYCMPLLVTGTARKHLKHMLRRGAESTLHSILSQFKKCLVDPWDWKFPTFGCLSVFPFVVVGEKIWSTLSEWSDYAYTSQQRTNRKGNTSLRYRYDHFHPKLPAQRDKFQQAGIKQPLRWFLLQI